MPGRRVIYWDACVFISILKGEYSDVVKARIAELDRQHLRGDIVLMTSALTRVEVFENQSPKKAIDAYRRLRERATFQEVAVDPKVADRARLLRETLEGGGRSAGLPKLTTPDAIHLATALLYEADELHTDEKALASFSKHPEICPRLLVCPPRSNQDTLLS